MVLFDSSGSMDSSTTGDYRPRHKPLQMSRSQVQLDRCWLPQHISDAISPLGGLAVVNRLQETTDCFSVLAAFIAPFGARRAVFLGGSF